ncbi:putative Na+/H+ antiporter [Aliarcobacter butzleri]|uniref:putative Na+/H+ antiporter n=1 Tax=Aliarcobacter butzleri TaxID=28197 RepID=UPI000DB0BCC3|nr:putative Na+/H+ antiporter [Aliarcobacter butzleri]MCG3651722.1 putative Na+/H+ antiporter [Aliarcobacter butzleri]MCG3665239.1 putative Na+/H+ antiporter [Aliarcobacter butzleri]MCG3678507.1 putative Na+/H+ antiporter [Aliarcobacter butzleri]MCT7603360.1 putative Na+/H+ antiporter [Aliarcobacter butzleri]MCT7650221.1 putative Na+/H+ antiporter [Aliarcobacter butzleri]
MPPTTLQIIAAVIFALAIIHIFSVKYFEHLAHRSTKHSGLFHLLGEIEVVFGAWALILILFMFILSGKQATVDYMNSRSYIEAMFVFVIMIIAATRPILQTVVLFVKKLSNIIPTKGATGFYFVVMFFVPILGSIITEPASMTLAALILSDKLFSQEISKKFRYATLGTLFVNVSIGGTLTNFAAPPILMVAGTWDWSTTFMFTTFGWKSMIAIFISTNLMILIFYKELVNIKIRTTVSDRENIPFGIILTHYLFLFLVVFFGHYPAIFMSIFLLFLGITHAYQQYQDRLMLREGLLVAFFLGGLVILGGQQQWWLQDLIMKMSDLQAFFAAITVGSVTDNAAITYLGSLVEGLTDEFKYALVAGAVCGGGLTVIANAPNPAGVTILKSHFEDSTIDPWYLFLGALVPTIISALCFLFL